jgi:O-methyltransferase
MKKRDPTKTFAKIKNIISTVLPDSYKLDIITRIPKLKTWEKKQTKNFQKFTTRLELYNFLQNDFLHGKPIDYLEFGVYKGETIDFWRKLNKNEKSKFYGFDTFTGLPEDWKNLLSDRPKGTWDCNGETPKIDDSRVQFFKGIFQDTLDKFLQSYESKNQLVIHNDSDLYSSTLYVLTRLHDHMKKDTIIIFDEFSNVMDEFRALEDYCSAYNRKYTLIAATDDFYQRIAIKLEN